MKAEKRAALQAKGWRIGDAEEFLGLSDEEAAFVALKLALGDLIRRVRKSMELTQTELAQRISSSQSRVAKMESADPSVTLDLQIRSLLSLGVSREQLAEVIGR